MKKNHYILYFLLVLIIGTLFGTGCVSEVNGKNNTNISSMDNLQQSDSSHSSSNNTSSWIIINPIDEHHRTETFEINGTTNLGVNEKLRYSISRTPVAVPIPCPTGPSNCPSYYIDGAENITYGDIVIIDNGYNGRNWSFLLNTSSPDYYDYYYTFFVLNVTSQDMTIHNTTTFTLLF